MKSQSSLILFGVLLTLGAVSCGTQAKLKNIQTRQMSATISLPSDHESKMRQIDTFQHIEEDTVKVQVDGHDMVIMKAVRDEKTGEMVATQELKAAVVTARFRNVAERHGKIDLEFQVHVPKEMQDPTWQLRFYPDMYILNDSIRLDAVYITGDAYRKAQLKGYEQYERFMSRIVSDTTKFIDYRNLEIWLQRNLPQIYAFRTDSTEVSDEQFESCFGVSERVAVDHYTNKFSKFLNNRRKARQGAMYRRYVKAPIVTEHIRLDTVMKDSNGDIIYNYIQTITTRPKLKKVDIVLSGEIYESDKQIYVIPRCEPLTFYISSLSSFADLKPRYIKKVIERKAEANAAWNIDFKVGKADIDETIGENAGQINNIKMNLRALVQNTTFDLDSITIAAFASPEGSVTANKKLTEERARSAVAYFNKFMKGVQDSLKAEAGMSVSFDTEAGESGMKSNFTTTDVKFKTSASGENWALLDALVEKDEEMTEHDKEHYRSLRELTSNLDERERKMQPMGYYKRIKNDMYPLLRTVQFNFFLHRKGMIKDTVHTTEIDTTYMKGVQAIINRDYEAAVALLGPYNDYNTAIAYVSLDRNVSAMSILEKLPETPQVNYMLAVLYSREGKTKEAIQHYLTSCKQDGSYVHRGNLDPEIAALIKKYNLNAQNDDEFKDLLPF